MALDRRQFLVTLGLVAATPQVVAEALATPAPEYERMYEHEPKPLPTTKNVAGYEIYVKVYADHIVVNHLDTVAGYRECYKKVFNLSPDNLAYLTKKGKAVIVVEDEATTYVPNGYTLEFMRRAGMKGCVGASCPKHLACTSSMKW